MSIYLPNHPVATATLRNRKPSVRFGAQTRPAAASEPQKLLEVQRRKVLEYAYFSAGGKSYTGLETLKLIHAILTEQEKDTIRLEDAYPFVLESTTSRVRSREIRNGLYTAAKYLGQFGLLQLDENRQGEIVAIAKTGPGRKLLGDKTEQEERELRQGKRAAQTTLSVLERISKSKAGDLESIASELRLSEMKVLATVYVDGLSGYDLLALTEEMHQRRGWLARLFRPGVSEKTLMAQFVLEEKKAKIAQALGELRGIGKLDCTEGKKIYWRTTQAGQERLQAGDPLKTGEFTPLMLEPLLQQAIDKIHAQQRQDRQNLERIQETLKQAERTVEELKTGKTAKHQEALARLAEADKASAARRLELENQAMTLENESEDLQYRIDLETQFLTHLQEQLLAAEGALEMKSRLQKEQIRKLQRAQVESRTSQISRSIELFIEEAEAMKADRETPEWASIVEQVDIDAALSRAKTNPAEQQLRNRLRELSGARERDRILNRLREEQRQKSGNTPPPQEKTAGR